MTAIVLHGRLKRDFGGPFDLRVTSAAEAVRALMAMLDGFAARFRDGAYRVVYGPHDAVRRGRARGGVELDAHSLSLGTSAPAIHIVPAAAGAGRGGVGKVILGAVIIAAAVITAIPTGGGSLAWGTSMLGGLTTAGSVAMFGASMMVAGISHMLSPMPQAPSATETDKTNSYLLGGQLNIYEQGGPIPLVYGRYRVGATLVSAGLDTAVLMSGGLKAPASGGSGGGSQVATVTAPGPLVTSERGYGPITLTPGAPGLHGFRITGIETPTDLVRGAVNMLGQGGGAAVNEGDVLTLAEGAAGVSFRSLVGGGQDTPIWPVFPKMTVQQMTTATEPYGEPVLFGANGTYVGDSTSDGGSGSAVGAPDNSGGPGHSDGNW